MHAKLFESDMATLGYPGRGVTQAQGEYFNEQRSLAMRRLKTGRERGAYDGLYLIGNAPIVLCEIKRYGALDTPVAWDQAKKQLTDYARSEDFALPPPFLVLYCGKPERNRFFRLKTLAEESLLGELEYEELDEIWTWERVKEFHARGEFAQEVVTRERLREILLHHLDRIEDDLRIPVMQAVRLVRSQEQPQILGEFAMAVGQARGLAEDAAALRTQGRRGGARERAAGGRRELSVAPRRQRFRPRASKRRRCRARRGSAARAGAEVQLRTLTRGAARTDRVALRGGAGPRVRRVALRTRERKGRLERRRARSK